MQTSTISGIKVFFCLYLVPCTLYLASPSFCAQPCDIPPDKSVSFKVEKPPTNREPLLAAEFHLPSHSVPGCLPHCECPSSLPNQEISNKIPHPIPGLSLELDFSCGTEVVHRTKQQLFGQMTRTSLFSPMQARAVLRPTLGALIIVKTDGTE